MILDVVMKASVIFAEEEMHSDANAPRFDCSYFRRHTTSTYKSVHLIQLMNPAFHNPSPVSSLLLAPNNICIFLLSHSADDAANGGH